MIESVFMAGALKKQTSENSIFYMDYFLIVRVGVFGVKSTPSNDDMRLLS